MTVSQITARLNRAGFLFDGHRRELSSDSAIDEEVLTERGYSSVMRPTAGSDEPRRRLARLGIPSWAYKEDSYFPGLLIPMYGPTGQRASFQWKPRRPVRNWDGKGMKYASPKGSPNRLDVHPRNVRYMADPTMELWVKRASERCDCDRCTLARARRAETAGVVL